MKYVPVQFNPSNTTADMMMDNITKAINSWELKVSKATNETRQMMLGFFNSAASNLKEGHTREIVPLNTQCKHFIKNTICVYLNSE
jgi:hypothetical protein